MSDSAEQEQDLRRRTWYVLHVKPRTEKKTFERLRQLNVFRYLPLFTKSWRVQRRKVVTTVPMFPGYVFTRLNSDERREVLKTQLVVRTIEVMQPRRMIHQLRQIAHAGRLPAELKPVTDFTVGEHVRVKSGPLMGMDGFVRRRGNSTTLVLALEILGQAVETSVNPDDLEKAEV